MNFLNFLLLSIIFSFPALSGTGYNANEINNSKCFRYELIKEYDSKIVHESKNYKKRKFNKCKFHYNYNEFLTLKYLLSKENKNFKPPQNKNFFSVKEYQKILNSKLLI
ncbi:MAG: hypothetical protein IAE65_00330 [Ignavibacteria bacterium]|nr:hypothetical protein [Ignavibacteria bacterium]